MLGHEASLTQCITNLLDNAVKFTSRGIQPRVRVFTEKREKDVRLCIEDQGIGIDAEGQRRLFQMLTHAVAGRSLL
jgi:signal transduction histidine kinase